MRWSVQFEMSIIPENECTLPPTSNEMCFCFLFLKHWKKEMPSISTKNVIPVKRTISTVQVVTQSFTNDAKKEFQTFLILVIHRIKLMYDWANSKEIPQNWWKISRFHVYAYNWDLFQFFIQFPLKANEMDEFFSN